LPSSGSSGSVGTIGFVDRVNAQNSGPARDSLIKGENSLIAQFNSLLELAEAIGLAPVFGCRSGICGTCATRITSGAVEYVEEPLATRGEGQVLLCCSIPAGAGVAAGGANPGIVLDL